MEGFSLDTEDISLLLLVEDSNQEDKTNYLKSQANC